MSPPQQDGTCCDDGTGSPTTRRRRAFWARTLGGCVVFGGLFVLAGVVFGAVLAAVWAFCRR